VVVISGERKKGGEWKTLALYGSLSLNLGIMILGGFYLGKLLEEHYHWANMTITGILIGLGLGLYEMFAYAYRSTKKK
jgi:hypothetical protein